MNKLTKILLLVAMTGSCVAAAENINVYCYHKSGYFMLQREVSDAHYLQSMKTYAVDTLIFENLNASCRRECENRNVEFLRVEASSICSGKLYQWNLGRVSLHYPLIGVQEHSPQELAIKSVLGEMPEHINLSDDMNNDETIRAYKNQVNDLKSIVPHIDFDAQFRLDFPRANFKVMNGERVIYSHKREDGVSSSRERLGNLFQVLQDHTAGSLQVQKNIAIALATLQQTFEAASFKAIFAPIQTYCDSHHDINPPQMDGSAINYTVMVDGESLLLEANYSYEMSTYDTGNILAVGFFDCHRSVRMELESGLFSQAQTTIVKYGML